jgi:hypothetical protein
LLLNLICGFGATSRPAHLAQDLPVCKAHSSDPNQFVKVM